MARSRESFGPGAYGAWFETPLGRLVWADEFQAMVTLLNPLAGHRILDAGCGDGRLAATLAREAERVIGVDANRDMLRAARHRRDHGAQVDLVGADLAALPFPNDSLDAVTAVTVFCFVAEPVAALRELARVVRPGGRVVVGELSRWSLWAVQRQLEARSGRGLLHEEYCRRETLGTARSLAGPRHDDGRSLRRGRS